jgi:PPM family protein phosphatase
MPHWRRAMATPSIYSDGLTLMLGEEEISRILEAEADPEEACRRLVARANEKGGQDNITLIVVRYEAAPE